MNKTLAVLDLGLSLSHIMESQLKTEKTMIYPVGVQ